MTINFGDDDPDDSWVEDNEPDPEPVARRLHELRRERGLEDADWDELNNNERDVARMIVIALLAWLRREGTRV